MRTPAMKIAAVQVELIAPRSELAYFDQRSAVLSRAVTPLEAWRLIMADPLPLLGTAFKVRDTVSGWFGVKPIGGFSGTTPAFVQTGDKLDFFTVETLSDTVLSLSSRDRHLDVLTCVTCAETTLTITSSVKVHNWFGRLYMLPVGPAHKLIVRTMLRRLDRSLTEAG